VLGSLRSGAKKGEIKNLVIHGSSNKIEN